MSEQVELITQEQLSLLKQLSQFQSSLEFHSLTQIPISILDINHKISQKQNFRKQDLRQLSKSIQYQLFAEPLAKKSNSSTMMQCKEYSLKEDNNSRYNGFSFIQKQLQKQGVQRYNQLKRKLIRYKQKSDQIYNVAQFIKSYEENFNFLVKQKEELIRMISQIKGETTQLVQKQKKLIDLSMTIKQSLDYYSYHQKNQFNYACEISSRQLFQDNLQSTLSTIMDAIQFFTQNQAFVQSKKHLNMYLNSKSKILSFIKSFYIKLFNKENSFVMKNLNFSKLDLQLNCLYPKSRMKLLNDFMMTFPHTKRYLKQILSTVKDQNIDNEQKQMQLKILQMRELEIDQFLLAQSNVSLIRYLEKNNFEIYSEVMLNLFTFNRFNYHQNLIFNWVRRLGAESQTNKISDDSQRYNIMIKQFKSKLYFVIQVIIAEYLYFQLCCHSSLPQSIEFFTSWIYKLTFKYLEVLVKQARQLVIRHKFNPFQLCEQISNIIDKELPNYFQNLSKEQYQSYVLGLLWHEVKSKTISNFKTTKNNQNVHSKFLKGVFKNSLKSKILGQLAQFCFQNLPKFQLTQKREEVQDHIRKLIYFIPKLQYCSSNAQNYMISSLDILIKSIKQINHSIQSRFECYSWNLIVFGVIRNILKTKQFEIVSKQIRLDFNQSLNIIDKVKQLDRSQSLIKYAQDIFNVLKTGMPSLNELTLDFNKYINEHYEELQSRFLKDILFIYAKNMIEFLQKAMDIKKRITLQKSTKNQQHMGVSLDYHKNKNLPSQQFQQEETKLNFYQETKNQKGSQNSNKQQNSLKKQSQQQKSPENDKGQKSNEMEKICDSIGMRSLYNSYILSIEKYIRQSCQMLKMVEECKIENKEGEVKNLKYLIREVYEKLFDFLDTFYVIVSEFNSQITSQFEQIAKIKEKQECLWFTTKS